MAAHLRHDHIGEQQVDRAAVVLGQAQGVGGTGRGQHRVAQFLEHALGDFQDRGLVVDDQQGFSAADGPCKRFRGGPGFAFAWFVGGQQQAHGPALARGTVHLDPAAQPPDHVPHHGQARIPDRGATAVPHGQGHRGGGGTVGPVDDNRSRGEGNAADPTDGLARIGAQGDEHLAQVGGIHAHRGQPGARLPGQGDAVADEAFQHAEGVGDGLVHVEHPRAGGLVAAQGQQVPVDVHRPGRSGTDLHEMSVQRRAALDKVQGHGRVGEDHAEHVVEVVADAARQPPEGGHPAGVVELLAQLLHLGGQPPALDLFGLPVVTLHERLVGPGTGGSAVIVHDSDSPVLWRSLVID